MMKNGGKTSWAKISKEDPIVFSLKFLGERPEGGSSLEIANLLLFLDDYLFECSRVEAAKIDQISYNRLTDMAAMHKVLDVVRMHVPVADPMTFSAQAIISRNTPHGGSGPRVKISSRLWKTPLKLA